MTGDKWPWDILELSVHNYTFQALVIVRWTDEYCVMEGLDARKSDLRWIGIGIGIGIGIDDTRGGTHILFCSLESTWEKSSCVPYFMKVGWRHEILKWKWLLTFFQSYHVCEFCFFVWAHMKLQAASHIQRWKIRGNKAKERDREGKRIEIKYYVCVCVCDHKCL